MNQESTLREKFNRADPDAWLALRADSSLPFDSDAKEAWIKDTSRWSRQFLFPLLKFPLKILMGLIQCYKAILPNFLTSSCLLHRIIVFNLKLWVTPEGNYLLMRHFHLGSQILNFLRDNIHGVDIETDPLFPEDIDAFKDNLILKHDINLYNFIIDLNLELREKNLEITPKDPITWESLYRPTFKVSDLPNKFTNFIDIQTAIEIILPLFQLLLSDREFWRSTHSLQLDETIGLYFTKLLGLNDRMFLVNNNHPMIPVSTGEAGVRLALHSLSTEILHESLLHMKEGKLQ